MKRIAFVVFMIAAVAVVSGRQPIEHVAESTTASGSAGLQACQGRRAALHPNAAAALGTPLKGCATCNPATSPQRSALSPPLIRPGRNGSSGSARPSTGSSSTGASTRFRPASGTGSARLGLGEWVMLRSTVPVKEYETARRPVQSGQVQRRRMGEAREGRGHEVHRDHVEASRRLRAVQVRRPARTTSSTRRRSSATC